MPSIRDQIEQVPLWRHRIPLPDGTVTPGSQDTLTQLTRLSLPEDLTGKTVLDIGCSDGFFSFECERRGAAHVLAIDNFSVTYIDKPTGFITAHEVIGSKVEFRQMDLFDLDSKEVGRFDLVLFLGVLYHLRHPLLGLEKVAELCAGQAIVETEITRPYEGWKWRLLARLLPETFMRFYEFDQINRDPTTFWVPSADCVEAMMRVCGFCSVNRVWRDWSRGIFHGFTPDRGNDAQQLLEKYRTEDINKVLGGGDADREAVPTVLVDQLRSLTIPEFAVVKQQLAEVKSRHWHQDERWMS